jgi:hypothetical protein
MTFAVALLFVASLAGATELGAGGGDSCAHLANVREIPFKADETPSDAAYRDIIGAGRSAIPCLVDRVTDVTPMPDPRKAPPAPGFVVGDLAVMLLAEVSGVPFDDLMPEEVRRRLPHDGVYAYFAYVATPSNRKALQDALRQRRWSRR